MKRILVGLLAAVMLVTFSACGEISDTKKEKPSDILGSSNEETQNISAEEVTVEEQVLVDEAGVKITAKSLDTDDIFGAELNLLIENNSGKNLTFQNRNCSVNGYMVETLMSVDVADGKKANDSVTFSDSDFELCGIEAIADMELSFHIFTTDDWETYLDTQPVQIKTSIADTYKYAFDDSGEVAYSGKDMKIVVKGLTEDSSILGPGITVYIENNNKENVTVQVREVSVNGFMVDSIFSAEVASGKRAVDTITFMEEDLEENGITAIEDVEMFFHIFDTDSWDEIVDTDVVKIDFQ